MATLEEIKRSQVFLDAITDAANKPDFNAGTIAALLGVFLRNMVKQSIEKTGKPPHEIELMALKAFMQGFGIPLMTPTGEEYQDDALTGLLPTQH